MAWWVALVLVLLRCVATAVDCDVLQLGLALLLLLFVTADAVPPLLVEGTSHWNVFVLLVLVRVVSYGIFIYHCVLICNYLRIMNTVPMFRVYI